MTTPPAAATPKKTTPHQKVKLLLSLLDRLTDGEGQASLERLATDPGAVEAVARDIATNTPVEVLAKTILTDTRPIQGVTEADYKYVGLPPEAEKCDFHTGYNTYLRPLLGKRADGFAAMYKMLDQQDNPLIIETGCLRVPGNWEGDGQSTFQFDWYAREKRGHVMTIDINELSINSARRACSSTTSTILNDSVAALNALSANAQKPAALLYLDSFDLVASNPMPSAMHHAMEVMAARRLIGPGTLLCIDDFNVPPLGPGGKGLIVNEFLNAINAEVLYSGYQKIWRVAV
ncbi:hypothetical protein E3E12_03145 [Formicincola oecophyllae]|uniref:Class I SAM-dependent methyltransferase n=1 Tax=Formicincola oecophyllae TaxID=2558361 RepID=A0A4Y6U7Q5_9PROT|nr:hypothetical protein [Formicincola oecophyllae]QDH13362.1 hypothetical protein E3E12_03145 [Formicincola oecophyllae]